MFKPDAAAFLGLSDVGRKVHTLANLTTRMFACLMGSDPMIILGFRVSLLYRFWSLHMVGYTNFSVLEQTPSLN
jgi:hypothetical protein